MADNERNELNRREFLRKAAITGAVAWAIPVVQSVAASPAYAQAACTPNACQHSLGGESGGGCMSACQGSGQGCGAACNNFCGANPGPCNCPGNFCRCPQVCDPAFWDNCVYGGPNCNTMACPC
jgi:hypothetical protein